MDARSLAKILVLSIAAVAPVALRDGCLPAALDASEVHALDAADDGSLDDLRAGVLDAPTGLDAGESAALERAAASDLALDQLRGGDIHLTDRELRLILITVAVVIVASLLI